MLSDGTKEIWTFLVKNTKTWKFILYKNIIRDARKAYNNTAHEILMIVVGIWIFQSSRSVKVKADFKLDSSAKVNGVRIPPQHT